MQNISNFNSIAPVNVNDKRVINGKTDINQLAPFKYEWAWEFFLKANNNHWTPNEINMSNDLADYTTRLTSAEKHLYENVLAYLTTADILAMRNIGLAVMEKMSAPELQIYQARQVYEESLHTWTYQHCIESLNLDQREIYNRYRTVPEIFGKIKISNKRLNKILKSDLDLTNKENVKQFILSYAFFAMIFEGAWFYNGFTPIFALQRRGLMKGTAEQFQYIMRDETLHATFGIKVLTTLMQEENYTPPYEYFSLMFEECLKAETDYINYLLPEPILGYNAEMHIEQYKYIVNRRCRQIGIAEPYKNAENVISWLDEQVNLKKEKNFFESRVTEYKTNADLDWGDD